MFWQTQTQRDIKNLEAEVRDLKVKYYAVQADMSRLLEHLKLVRIKTPEQAAFVPVDSELAKQHQARLYIHPNVMRGSNPTFWW
jgi:arginine repressor